MAIIAQTFRGPHGLYRRYQALLESALTAASFALLVSLALTSLGVYPDKWVVVVGVGIGVLGIRWPGIAYILAVLVMLYPVYTVNLYLAVLFLAISALGHRHFTHYLGATTLVLATPLLAEYHLHWLVPVLGGIWWGGLAGAWIGGLAAMWGKIIGGMAGLDIDWLVMAGTGLNPEAIAANFAGANSLQTLLLLVEPFAATSSVILYNLLQVVGWTAAGGFVGSLAWRKWVKYRTPWSILVVSAGGGLIMLATHVGLPYWLTDAVTGKAAVTQDPVAPLYSLLVVILVTTTVYSLRESLDLPVAPKQSLWARRAQAGGKKPFQLRPFAFFRKRAKAQAEPVDSPVEEKPVADKLYSPRRPVRVPHHSELPEWEPPKHDTGLIMLEID